MSRRLLYLGGALSRRATAGDVALALILGAIIGALLATNI